MTAFNTVIFDLDGVIIDSRSVMKKVFARAFKEIVGPGEAPFEEFKKHLGLGLPKILEKMGLPPEMRDVFVRESYRLAGQIKVFDSITKVLKTLSLNNILLGIATGKDGKRSRSLLSQLGLLSYFNLIVGSDEVKNGKPAPDIILVQLAYFHSNPEQTLMIGDAISDIQAGKAASVFVAAALWGIEENEKLIQERPNYILQTPEDILSVIDLKQKHSPNPIMSMTNRVIEPSGKYLQKETPEKQDYAEAL